jgi:hypothetical protein
MRQQRPDLPIVLMTGFGEILAQTKAEMLRGMILLPKPFTPDALMSALQRSMDAADDARSHSSVVRPPLRKNSRFPPSLSPQPLRCFRRARVRVPGAGCKVNAQGASRQACPQIVKLLARKVRRSRHWARAVRADSQDDHDWGGLVASLAVATLHKMG